MAPKNMTKAESDGVYEFPYVKPERLKGIRSLAYSIYDPREHSILGRTCKNWGGIILFYTIFFSGLAAMFAICMYGLLATLDEGRPKYLLDSSIIGSNPGLGYRPIAENFEHSGSLIWYVATNQTNVDKWTKSLDSFLADYKADNRNIKGIENRISCSDGQVVPAGKVCDVPLDSFKKCTNENGYSFNKSSPCVFIKLNRIFGWVPSYYNDTNDLPEEMDASLKTYISEQEDKNSVWVSCHGENVADREAIGSIAYYPRQGFAGYFYPFTNTPGYLSPLVAVHFERVRPNTLINVECRAWAKNIHYERARGYREGSVHFELLVD